VPQIDVLYYDTEEEALFKNGPHFPSISRVEETNQRDLDFRVASLGESFIAVEAKGTLVYTDDFHRDHDRLRSRGFVFVREPRNFGDGTAAVFEDLYANRWDLLEPRDPRELHEASWRGSLPIDPLPPTGSVYRDVDI